MPGPTSTASRRKAPAALVAGLALALLAPRAAAAVRASGATEPAPAVVLVGAGETLWDLARRLRPNDDPRRFVHEVRALNGLSGAAIHPGQRLRLPPAR